MSTELKPCPICGGKARITKGYATEEVWAHGTFYRAFCESCQLRQLFYRTEPDAADAWNRRTAPVSAPLDTQALPDLPKCIAYGVVGLTGLDPNDGHRQLSGVSVGKPGAWARNSLVELYTANQYRQGQIELIAPYAERIRQLERELAAREVYEVPIPGDGVFGGMKMKIDPTLPPNTIEMRGANRVRINLRTGAMTEVRELAERKPASIDTAEFRKLLDSWIAQRRFYTYESNEVKKAWSALIAYIDGHTDVTAPELYTCIGKGGEYEHIGVAAGAGVTRGNLVHVYRDKTSGNLFYRTPMDFDTRMAPLAAAPSSMSKGKEEANADQA